ncbi:hypothetical protein Pfo_005257, partial [Paulownia fortunei]
GLCYAKDDRKGFHFFLSFTSMLDVLMWRQTVEFSIEEMCHCRRNTIKRRLHRLTFTQEGGIQLMKNYGCCNGTSRHHSSRVVLEELLVSL